jgi:hypothetical protein
MGEEVMGAMTSKKGLFQSKLHRIDGVKDFWVILRRCRKWVGLTPPLPMSWDLSASQGSRGILWMGDEVYDLYEGWECIKSGG